MASSRRGEDPSGLITSPATAAAAVIPAAAITAISPAWVVTALTAAAAAAAVFMTQKKK